MIVQEILATDVDYHYRQVVEAKIVDAGDNEFATITTEKEILTFMQSHRGGPYYLVATKLGEKVDPSPGDWDQPADVETGNLGMAYR